MAQATIPSANNVDRSTRVRMATVAWLLTAIFYFYQYALRSAPAVMMPQLSDAFGLSTLGVASIVGLFYYGYSPFSLVAGAAMDRLGPRRLLPFAAVVVGIGALLFATRKSRGRECRQVPAGRRWSLCAGRRDLHRHQKLSRLARRHVDRRHADVWNGGRIGRTVRRWAADRPRRCLEPFLDRNGRRRPADRRCALFSDTRKKKQQKQSGGWLKSTCEGFGTVFKNPQSILCGLICRLAVHPDNDLRHDLGRPLSPGSARSGVRLGGHALGRGSLRLDHWLPAAWLHFRSDRTAQAGDHRRGARAACLSGLDPLRQDGRLPAVRDRSGRRTSHPVRRCCRTP